MPGEIRFEREGGIATLRIANPAKYNAMSLAMWQTLGERVTALAGDPTVRVLVLRGDGERAFVSGADISEFDRTRSAETGSDAYDQAVDLAQQALIDSPVPVVAAIRGVCMGGGLALAMSCDLRYATTDARFRMPAARLGLGYGYAGIRRMVGQVGAARVADLFFTARTFDGTEAARIGVASDAFAPDRFEAAVAERVTQIAENAPLTVRLAKRAIAFAEAGSEDPATLAALAEARRACIASADYAEGRRAFAEKRLPKFVGR
ncbi:MAG: enoyl-CoA hydratase [Lautropia sp.]